MEAGARPLTSLDETLRLIVEPCIPVESSIVPIFEAIDKIIAEDVAAAISLPKSNTALREGWAVRAEDTYGATSLAPNYITSEPDFVALGKAVTGSADALLPDYALNSINGMAEILAAAVPGENIRRAGEDIAQAEVIAMAGEKLTSRQALILRLAEIDEVPVFLPRFSIFAGKSFESSAFMAEWLVHLARAEGARTEIVSCLSTMEAITEAFARSDADLILVLSESGSDFADFAIRALNDLGSILAQGLATRPGETMICGLLPKPASPVPIPAIFAPQRLEHVLAAWLLLIRPCLERLMNKKPDRAGETLVLNRKISSSLGRSDLVVLQVQKLGERRYFEPLGVGDFTWSAIAKATHWLLVPPQSEGYAKGEAVFGKYFK
jgi:molybdopterin biosynthesis enzyme